MIARNVFRRQDRLCADSRIFMLLVGHSPPPDSSLRVSLRFAMDSLQGVFLPGTQGFELPAEKTSNSQLECTALDKSTKRGSITGSQLDEFRRHA